MPLFDYECKSCKATKEILTGSHITIDNSVFNCSCGGKFEQVFTPSELDFDVPGGYYDTYVRQAKLQNPTHKANYLADDSVSPY